MRKTLRRGASSVYLQYESGGDTIRADNFEAALEGSAAVIRFHLKPVDENQRIDERRLHSDALTAIHLSDDYIIDNLEQFLSHRLVSAQELRVQILSQGRALDYTVAIGVAGTNFLPLLVQRLPSQ